MFLLGNFKVLALACLGLLTLSGCAMTPEQIESEKAVLQKKYNDFFFVMSENKKLSDALKGKFPSENFIIECDSSVRCEDYLVKIEGAIASKIDFKVRISTRAVIQTFEPTEAAYKEFDIQESRLEKTSDVLSRCLAYGTKKCDVEPRQITVTKTIRELSKDIGKTSAKAVLENMGDKKIITVNVTCLLPSQIEYNRYADISSYLYDSYKEIGGTAFPTIEDSFDMYYKYVKGIKSKSDSNNFSASNSKIGFYDTQKDYTLLSNNCMQKKLDFFNNVSSL